MERCGWRRDAVDHEHVDFDASGVVPHGSTSGGSLVTSIVSDQKHGREINRRSAGIGSVELDLPLTEDRLPGFEREVFAECDCQRKGRGKRNLQNAAKGAAIWSFTTFMAVPGWKGALAFELVAGDW